MAAVALYIVVSTVWWTVLAFNPVPFWDQWNIIRIVLGLSTPDTWWLIWTQHNDHRLVIPALITLLDFRFFRGTGALEITLMLAMQAISALLLIRLALDRLARVAAPAFWRVFAAALVPALVFSALQMENLAWPLQTCFIGLWFFSIVAFYALARSIERGGAGWIAVGGVAAISSFLCLAGGIGTMAVFLAGLIAGRQSWRRILPVAIAFAAATAIFFYRYRWDQIDLASLLPVLVPYIADFLGNAAGAPNLDERLSMREPIPDVIPVLGALGIVLVTLALALWLRDRRRDGSVIALMAVVALGLSQAILAGLGRYSLGVKQAMSSRYITPTLFFWAGLLTLLLSYALRSGAPLRYRLAVSALAFLLVAHLAWQQWPMGEMFQVRARHLELAADSLRVGVRDDPVLSYIHEEPQTVLGMAPALQSNRESVFADKWYSVIGRRLDQVMAVDAATVCPGAIESEVVLPGGARVSGWVGDADGSDAPDRIVLTDGTGVIIGLGSPGFQYQTAEAPPLAAHGGNGWEGYARPAAGVTAYAVSASGSGACRLDGTVDTARLP
jgi:hypothetical protein